MKAAYKRIRHAAHTGNGGGWDIEQWDAIDADDPGGIVETKIRSDVPRDAEYHSGYVDRQGNQHWLYTRKAPLSEGICACCK